MLKLRRLEDRIVLDGAGIIEAIDYDQDADLYDDAHNQDVQDVDNGIDSQEPLYLSDNASDMISGGQDDGGVHLLVISSDIDAADDLANAAKDGVLVVRYDASDTSLDDLAGMIQDALGGQKADSIAFATHNTESGQLNLTKSDIISSDSLDNDAAQQSFWLAVGESLSQDGRIDLLACNLVSDDAGEAIVEKIENLSGANVAASDDATGNEAYGGDWVLESDGVDIQGTYFDSDAIANFDGVLENSIPGIVVNKILQVDENNNDPSVEVHKVIDNTYLQVKDADNTADQLVYTVGSTTFTKHGTLWFDTNDDGIVNNNESALKAGSKFTQANIDAGSNPVNPDDPDYIGTLTYKHNGTYEGPLQDRFDFTATDGTSSVNGIFNIAISAVNDAPVPLPFKSFLLRMSR